MENKKEQKKKKQKGKSQLYKRSKTPKRDFKMTNVIKLDNEPHC